MTTLKDRIDRLRLFSIERRPQGGRFGTRAAIFNEGLEREFGREALECVEEWHWLAGSSPWPGSLSPETLLTEEVVRSIEAFISEVETQWGVGHSDDTGAPP